MLSLHAQHYPDERPGTADSTRNATGSNTPAQGPKKVISFGAYKSKKTGETPVRDGSGARDADKSGKQPAVKGPAERVKALEAESADMIKAVEENERSETARDASDRKDAQRRKDGGGGSYDGADLLGGHGCGCGECGCICLGFGLSCEGCVLSLFKVMECVYSKETGWKNQGNKGNSTAPTPGTYFLPCRVTLGSPQTSQARTTPRLPC
jgi:hypothetical protein